MKRAFMSLSLDFYGYNVILSLDFYISIVILYITLWGHPIET